MIDLASEQQLVPQRRRKLPTKRLEVREVRWDEFYDWFVGFYRQNQHVTLIGPTQTGKTTIAREILEARECVIAIAIKPEDEVAESFVEYGYRIQEKRDIPTVEKAGRPVPHPAYRRIVLWPRAEQDRDGRWRSIPQMTAYQRSVIMDAINYVRKARRWTLFTDDLNTLAEDLKLGPEVKWILRNGASAKISLVGAGQRPAWLPREAYSSPEHLFFLATNDADDLDRLSNIGAGVDKKELAHVISNLKLYETLYLAPRVHPPILIKTKVEIGRSRS
ncbi:MAG: hypothetical protein ACRD2H_13945 [Terriglobales bacterium]